MKKVKGKKLELKKLSVAKLSDRNMYNLKGGKKSREPNCKGGDDIIFNSMADRCETRRADCTAPTVIGF